MNVSAGIERSIDSLLEGQLFGYDDLGIKSQDFTATAKKLERLRKKGRIVRIKPGLFYVPQKTVFGEKPPREETLLRSILYKNGKRIAYITGLRAYNAMGLTTQIPDTIKIASRERIPDRIMHLKFKNTKSYVAVTEDNYRFLQLLDAVKDFKKLPVDALETIKNKVLNIEDLSTLIPLALQYPPRARALIGAILELTGNSDASTILFNSLNPLSEYDLGNPPMANKERWKIR